MQETQVQSLGQEDPPENRMATHSSILAWEIPWTEKPGGLQFMGWQRIRHDWATKHTHTHTHTHSNMGLPRGLRGRICLSMQETQQMWIQSPGQEDPLEKEMTTQSSIFAWRIPWTEVRGRLQSLGSQRVGHNWACMNANIQKLAVSSVRFRDK